MLRLWWNVYYCVKCIYSSIILWNKSEIPFTCQQIYWKDGAAFLTPDLELSCSYTSRHNTNHQRNNRSSQLSHRFTTCMDQWSPPHFPRPINTSLQITSAFEIWGQSRKIWKTTPHHSAGIPDLGRYRTKPRPLSLSMWILWTACGHRSWIYRLNKKLFNWPVDEMCAMFMCQETELVLFVLRYWLKYYAWLLGEVNIFKINITQYLLH